MEIAVGEEVSKKVRTKEEVATAQEKLSPIVAALLQQRDTMNAAPVPIERVTSGYGLPVKIGMRSFDGGVVIGLFEDRTNLVSGKEPLIPIGQVVMEYEGYDLITRKNDDEHMRVFVGKPFYEDSEYKPGGAKSHDRFFGPLAAAREYDGLSVGLLRTYDLNRSESLDNYGLLNRDTPEEQKFDRNHRKKLYTLSHTKRGLGTLLLDTAVMVTKQMGKTGLVLQECSDDSISLAEGSGYDAIRSDGEVNGDDVTSITIKTT